MKTSIKLVLIYMLIQLCASFLAAPMLVVYNLASGNGLEQMEAAGMPPFILSVVMLLSMAVMAFYLWKAGYLKACGQQAWKPTSAACLLWTVAGGAGLIVLTDALMSWLSFLPDLMEGTFTQMSGDVLGVLCLVVLGPVLEELLFRGAVTRLLLQQYRPWTAIVLSGLIFGIFHINPAQIPGAALMGVFLAWLYWRTQSMVPGIVLHVLNNGLSVWLMSAYPDVDTLDSIVDAPLYYVLLAAGIALLALAWWMLHRSAPRPECVTPEIPVRA